MNKANNIEIRIYFEVLEQAIDIKEYVINALKYNTLDIPIKLVYAKKIRGAFLKEDSLVNRIRKVKDIDIMLSIVNKTIEEPLLLMEYSTAVPTDDHIMQRSDVLFWGAKYKIPILKISPLNKGMDGNHGGGNKIDDDLERNIALKQNLVYLPIKWDIDHTTKTLLVDQDKLSCIPTNKHIQNFINDIFYCFKNSNNSMLFEKYIQEDITKSFNTNVADLKLKFPDSQRIKWDEDNLTIKINRFGHALDPDRGMLYFFNMLLGSPKISVEFQVERKYVKKREGYRSLFDGISNQKELEFFVKDLMKNKKNILSPQDAVCVFMKGLNILKYFPRSKWIENNTLLIDDTDLSNYLFNGSGMAAKSVFFLSNKIILTSKKRHVLATITFNTDICNKYLSELDNYNKNITELIDLDNKQINEDVITYSSIQIFKSLGLEIIATSYPGAQGDRCILLGNGRKTKREYIDIIASKKHKNNLKIFLQENKEIISGSKQDIKKLNTIKKNDELKDGLKRLLLKYINNDNIQEIIIGIGGNGKTQALGKIDYLMLFNIKQSPKFTSINCQVALVNLNLLDDFKNLIDTEKKLQKNITIAKLFVIA